MASFLDPRLTRRSLLRGAVGGAVGLGLVGASGELLGRLPAANRRPARLQAPTATWSQLTLAGPTPSARRDHSLTYDEARGVLYLYGGRVTGPDRGLEDLWRFDPGTGRWAQVEVQGPVPPGRFGHNAAYDSTSAMLIVALGQASSTASYDDVWAFDPETSAWRQLSGASEARPVPRYGAGGGYDPTANRLFISHGFTIEGRFDDTWQFDVAGDAWVRIPTTGQLPVSRCLTRGFWHADSGRFLLFGGQSDLVLFHGDFWSLDLQSGQWTEHTPAELPSPRNLYGGVLDRASGRWYVFGGNTEGGPVADLWAYDPSTDAWTPAEVSGPTPSSRQSMDMAWTPGRVFMFGGNDGGADLADTWALDLGR